MTEPIRLKSRLLREGDPRQVDISQFQIPLTVDPKIYERDLLNFRRRYSTVEDAAEAAAQDMVTLTCKSENPRFCKEHITIRIGLGLFSKELEEQILGWKPGQSGSVTVKGEDVNVAVERIQREKLPEVDDVLAARCGIPGIQTAGDIHAHCKGKQLDEALEEPLDEAFAYLSRTVLEASEFELDPEELTFSQEQMIRELNKNSAFRGAGMNGMPEESFRELFGCTKAELLESMRLSGTFILQSALLGQAMLEREGRLLTMEDYEAYLRRYLDIDDKPEEQVRRDHPILGYLLDTYSDFCMNALEALTLRRLKENIV